MIGTRLALLAALLVSSSAGCIAQTGPGDTLPSHDGGVTPDGDADPPPPFTPDACKWSREQGAAATAALGHGQLTYLTLTDDQALTWEAGPQGGHHVWIAARTFGLHQFGTITTVSLTDVESASDPHDLGYTRIVMDLSRDEGGRCVIPGIRAQLDGGTFKDLASMAGHHIRVRLEMRDIDGTSVSAERTIVVGPPASG